MHFCYVVMRSDIAADPKFSGLIEPGRLYDYATPYGYGGPLCDSPIPESSQLRFLDEMKQFARQNNIVSQFVRFHPLSGNHEAAPAVFETRYLHDTIYIDTRSPERILANMDGKNRNMIRKAVKNGVSVVRKSISEYQEFIPVYIQTMKNAGAADYYFFGEDYFRAQQALEDHACIFYAMLDGQVISAAIMYYNDRFIHYHLAGTRTEFRRYAAGNLLLYEAACRAGAQGIEKFHLGGGLTGEDSLFGFKKQFNKYGRLPFYIGRTIFQENTYQELLHLRQRMDPSFDVKNTRMIQYRA